MTPPQTIPFLGLALLVPLMAYAWNRQRQTENAGTVDLIWAGSLGVLAIAYGLLGDGWAPRRALVATLAALWYLRLTLHLHERLSGEAEDGRYAILRERWGARFNSRLFWFFQIQALLAVLLSLTFLVLCNATETGWRSVDAAALGLWLLALLGQTIADRQLRAWRTNPSHRGRTCRSGLWAYSRHPNYFFEWLGWCVYPLLGVGLPLGMALWLTPALMLLLVLRVTGIPPTEAQALLSRGDDYRAYQASTNAFFPGPAKRAP